MEYVYHVVTERPMNLGQCIKFDERNHNGVYDRVMTFKRIIDGEDLNSELSEMIKSDMEKWGKVAYRELALEEVRRKYYSDYPSRMACLYTTKTFDEAKNWAFFFESLGRNVISIAMLRVEGRIFHGDACNCFDGTGVNSDIENAHLYWQNNKTDKPVIETLVDGVIFVEELWDWNDISEAESY